MPDSAGQCAAKTSTNAARPAGFVLITPVRDEDRFIQRTLDSVIAQTRRPEAWVIVDDGSSDRTVELVEDAAAVHDWIVVLKRSSGKRDLGCAEVLAFLEGYALACREYEFEYIVKLDGDVELDKDYFERVLGEMDKSPSLGIASGVYCEKIGEEWEAVDMPDYHAAGASKVVRIQCYEVIGGFIPRKGWDTVDEIRARLNGWQTGHFRDIQFRHLKPEGTAMGSLATHRFHGEIYYQTGGGAFFLFFKALHRMIFSAPRVVGGLALLAGYFQSLVAMHPKLVSSEEARFYRKMLNERMRATLSRVVRRMRIQRGP